MKDGDGSSILFYIILGFIGIFIVFIAVIMNYASAYRTNNYVVTLIEQYEGYKFGSSGDKTTDNTIVGYLKRNNYYNKVKVSCTEINNINAVYSVETYVNFYIPLIDVGFPIPIKNDTKTLYNVNCKKESIGEWNGS